MKFRNKPGEFEAVQWVPDEPGTFTEMILFISDARFHTVGDHMGTWELCIHIDGAPYDINDMERTHEMVALPYDFVARKHGVLRVIPYELMSHLYEPVVTQEMKK